MSKSILSLPPVLQGVWRDVYAATIAGFEASCESSTNLDVEANYSEERAWEAVRRANGGEMPEERAESVVLGPREPTDEEMVEALAKIVANAVSPGTDPEVLDLARRSLIEEDVPDLDGDMLAASIAAFQAWKAARAWGRK